MLIRKSQDFFFGMEGKAGELYALSRRVGALAFPSGRQTKTTRENLFTYSKRP